jgi:NAD(P)-dependent dehydrogenase (short-subunit alcohol dehydrogenase family)
MDTTYNPFSLEGKQILVIGASSGIGREIAIECSKMGAIMIIASRNIKKMNDTIIQMDGGEHQCIEADITKQTDIENIVDSVPVVDGMLIASGASLSSPIPFCTRERFNQIYDLNFFAYTELTRLMYKKKKMRQGGSIVFISSVASGFKIVPGNSVYGTAKAALDAFKKYCALEFAARKIRVNTINPGMVNTPLTASGIITDDDLQKDMEKYPLKRYGEPEDIAPAAIYLLSDASKWMTGQSLIVDGGISII